MEGRGRKVWDRQWKGEGEKYGTDNGGDEQQKKKEWRIRTRLGESINTNSKRRHKDESTLTHVDLADFF